MQKGHAGHEAVRMAAHKWIAFASTQGLAFQKIFYGARGCEDGHP